MDATQVVTDAVVIAGIVDSLLTIVLKLVDRGVAKTALDRLAVIQANAAFAEQEMRMYPNVTVSPELNKPVPGLPPLPDTVPKLHSDEET
jgi:hypothetical protein